MHQITLHVTSLEFEIIKKQAARLYLGVAPEQIALYVRNSLVELLTEANLLTRDQLVEAITEETQSSASKSMTTIELNACISFTMAIENRYELLRCRST
jgi:hypothetical protein